MEKGCESIGKISAGLAMFAIVISINTGFEALFQMDRYGIMESIRLNIGNADTVYLFSQRVIIQATGILRFG